MKSYLLKEELSSQCAKLSIQLTNMDVYEHRIPQIELDIFLRNIQDLYEKALELKASENYKISKTVRPKTSVNENTEPTLKIEKSVSTYSTIDAIETIDKEILEKEITEDIKQTAQVEMEEEIPVPIAKSTMQEVKTAIIPDKKTEKNNPIIEEKQEIVTLETTAETTAEIKQEILIETPLEDDPSFNDLLEENPSRDDLFSSVRANQEILDLNRKLAEARGNHSLAEKLQNQQIENLKSVIGINDKFYFINELFDGDSSRYEDVIYTLNNFKKFDDAMQYFSTLKYRFNWNEESDAPEMLIKMLERKFDLIGA